MTLEIAAITLLAQLAFSTLFMLAAMLYGYRKGRDDKPTEKPE